MSRKIAVGAMWMLLSKALERVLSVFSTLILARLLVPGDFGIVAMGLSLVALIELFKAFGLETAIIQRQDASEDHYHTAWTLNVLAGLVVGITIAAAAIPASAYYREPRLALVIAVLGLSAVVQGCENIGVVDFRKKLQFDRDFWYLLNQKIMGFVIVMPLAFYFRNYLALVYGILGTRLAVLAYSYIAHPFRPRFSLIKLHDLFHFSKWVLPMNLLGFLRERSADFILGRTSGAHALGVFSISSQLASMPSTELVAPINRALLPVYASLKHDILALRRQYLNTMSAIATLALPAICGLAITAPLIVAVLLGNKWLDATPVLSILAVIGITQIVQSNSSALFIALGKPSPIVWIGLFQVAALAVGLILLSPGRGALGAAWAFAIASVLALPVTLTAIVRISGVGLREFLAVLWRPFVASSAMYGLLAVGFPGRSRTQYTSSAEAVAPLMIEVALGIVAYALVLITLWRYSGRPAGPETWTIRQVKRVLRIR